MSVQSRLAHPSGDTSTATSHSPERCGDGIAFLVLLCRNVEGVGGIRES